MDFFVTSRRRSNVGHRALAVLEVAEADSRAGRHSVGGFLVAGELWGGCGLAGAFLMPLPVRELREARGAARPDHMDDLLITGCPKKFADVQNALRPQVQVPHVEEHRSWARLGKLLAAVAHRSVLRRMKCN